MKVYSISILLQTKSAKNPIILAGKQDVSEWSFFTRSRYILFFCFRIKNVDSNSDHNSIRDFMVFTTRTVYSKVKDSKASVQEKDYFCHCLKGKDGLGAVIIADAEYKQQLAFGLMTDLVIQFKKKFDMRSPPVKAKCSKDHQFDEAFPELAKLLVDCQDPRKVDKVLKIHSQIDQTKAVMYVVVVVLFECAFE